jgi:hypothetical protein
MHNNGTGCVNFNDNFLSFQSDAVRILWGKDLPTFPSATTAVFDASL